MLRHYKLYKLTINIYVLKNYGATPFKRVSQLHSSYFSTSCLPGTWSMKQ